MIEQAEAKKALPLRTLRTALSLEAALAEEDLALALVLVCC